jgi:hypothetical protein
MNNLLTGYFLSRIGNCVGDSCIILYKIYIVLYIRISDSDLPESDISSMALGLAHR